ncbi:hypothetical protein F503_00162 [Ophiostoma piceae UAMH 11346]|uniref:Uncharacterized protein n=1 Tax=Ophiostoma piceae (strain UAMH 11346) TaxID=1262450 RepID=S3CFB4_OPHP1|nr:hypothetical protein F503_00162 [Ophiostoma piceae UAMH 11346]
MRPPAAASAPVADGDSQHKSQPSISNHQINFKTHKSLPHPRKDTSYASLRTPCPRAALKNQSLPLSTTAPSSSSGTSTDETAATNSQPSSPHTSKGLSKSVGNGPDLPPTPPAHSRNSSSTYSALPSTATYVQSPERSAEDVQNKAAALPTTPTKQMSPPTPDVTPPQALQLEIRPRGPPHRPPLRDRNLSKGTDSRAESFKTAQEHLSSSSSEDEAALINLRPAPSSARTSESTVRQLTNGDAQPAKKRQPKVVGLGLGLESSPESSLTPQSKRDFVSFDGEWGTGSEELVKERGGNLSKNAAPQSHQIPRRNAANPGQVVDDVIVAPTNATKAVHSMSLPQRILTFPPPSESATRSVSQTHQPKWQQPHSKQNTYRRQGPDQHLATAAPILSDMVPSADPLASDKVKRSSTASSRSTVSTVVEAVLMSTPPQRQRTLRHVRKQVGLRDSGLDLSQSSSGTTSLADETARQRRPNGGRFGNSAAHDSVLSTSTFNSISSRSARREIWKSGGIPVVVVPSRMSSVKSTSREPSLRSTSSRRSKRSQSLHSVPVSQIPKSRDTSPAVDQRSSRGRTMSESGGSARDGSARGDQRTIDFPPIVPRRTSSLSAPTSRNVSRSGSLTAESAHAHTAILNARTKEQQKTPSTADVLDQVQAKLEVPSQAPSQANSNSQLSKSPSRVTEARVVKPANSTSILQHRQPARLELFPEIKLAQVLSAEVATSPKLREFSDHGDDTSFENRNLLDPRSSANRQGDRNTSKHLSPHTPFSIISVETTTSHHSQAEVSEALAVNIYSHQNTSVLVVNHSNRPSEHSDDSQQDQLTDCTEASTPKQEIPPIAESGPIVVLSPFVTEAKPSVNGARPKITTSGRGEVDKNDVPATPSQQLFSLDDVDSPLRNPRAPPQPPAINFIPATPSGLTPTNEKGQERGAYFGEEDNDGRPRRRRSVSVVLRRALSRGRSATTEYGPSASRTTTTEYGPSASRSGGIFSRTLSLTRDVQKKARSIRRSDSVDKGKGAFFDDEPVEEDKLHPFWQPSSWNQDDDDEGETYRYPPIDNRPHPPRRSLSMRMKRTFAILPLEHDDSYPATEDGTERRTVRRTPSGNLRVVRHLSSSESLKERSTPAAEDGRPYTAPGDEGGRFRVWRSLSLNRGKRRYSGLEQYEHASSAHSGRSADEKRPSILPIIGGKIGELGPHTLSRRFSERRREKRSNELRQMISGPREVRDGVGEVVRRTNYRDAFTQAQTS